MSFTVVSEDKYSLEMLVESLGKYNMTLKYLFLFWNLKKKNKQPNQNKQSFSNLLECDPEQTFSAISGEKKKNRGYPH